MADVFTRSKSAPAIHNKNKVIDRDEDDDLHASNGNVGRNGRGVNGTAKSNGAASASNGNYDSEDSDNEGPKDGDKVRPQQKVPFRYLECYYHAFSNTNLWSQLNVNRSTIV